MTRPMSEQWRMTVADVFTADERLALVLADVNREHFEAISHGYTDRIFNVGIMEQTMIGLSAGLAMEGMIPVVHTDAPFLVERPFEQIKADFCYQNLAGNFVSTGASYDYAFEGMSHQGPADVPLLRVLPGMQVVLPGTGAEF